MDLVFCHRQLAAEALLVTTASTLNAPWWVACTQTCRLNKLREQQADGAPDPWLQPAVRLQDQQPVITDDRLEFRIDFWALQLTTCHQRSVADDASPAAFHSFLNRKTIFLL